MRFVSPLLLAATLSLAALAPALAETRPTLTVTGTGSVATTPDLATVSLGLTTTGATATEAMSANSDALTAVIAQMKAAGVEDRDIQSSSLSLNPNWVMNASSTASEVQGYVATNIVTVRIRDLAQTGAVLDAAIADGANTLNWLTLGLQNPRPHEDAARRAAVADAVAIATLLSEAAGTKLGPILSIQEGGGPEPMPGAMFRTMADAASMPVEAGSVDVTASVTMVFAIGE